MILKRLKELVDDTELSKQEFAENINLSKQKYYKTENGIRNLQVEDVVNIAKVYNINLNWLLLGLGDKKQKSIVDRDLQSLIDYLSVESKGSQPGYDLLIEATIKNIIDKLKVLNGLFKSENNRPKFLLMKILKNIKNDNETLDFKGYLEKIILEDEKEWKKTKEMLLYSLKKLKDTEVDFIVKYRIYFIEIVEKKCDFLTKFLFMNKLTN